MINDFIRNSNLFDSVRPSFFSIFPIRNTRTCVYVCVCVHVLATKPAHEPTNERMNEHLHTIYTYICLCVHNFFLFFSCSFFFFFFVFAYFSSLSHNIRYRKFDQINFWISFARFKDTKLFGVCLCECCVLFCSVLFCWWCFWLWMWLSWQRRIPSSTMHT